MLRLGLALPEFALLLLAIAVACSRPGPVRQQSTPATAPSAAADPTRPSDAGPGAGEAEARPVSSADGHDPAWAVLESRIHFDFDRSDLSGEARSALAAKLTVLLANPDVEIQIVGHADERGSDEYNLALGLERAAAAKRFLTQRGVAPHRISAISMGEERPLCAASNESCWWQNRRNEFVVLSPARTRRP